MDNNDNWADDYFSNERYTDPGHMQDRESSKKILSQCGWYLSLIMFAVIIVQIIAILVSKKFYNAFYESDWFSLTVTAIGMLGVGLPLAFGLLNKLPDSKRGEKKRLSPGKFLGYFFVCYAALYFSNLVTIIINSVISSIKGSEVINPIEDVLGGSNMVSIILYASILGPIAEELIFRKLLLDKLRRFGDLPAILLTSIGFGLFHMNLSQVLYAAAVGMVMAYVTIKTNTVIYSILIHMMVNFIGSGLSILVLNSENAIAFLLFSAGVCVFVTIGTVIFVKKVKTIELSKPDMPLVRKRDYILNSGTIAFIIICLVEIVAGVIQ